MFSFHINTCSLNKNFDDREYLIKTANQDFDIEAVSEARLKKDLNFTSNINLLSYVIKYTLTEANTGGTLLVLMINYCINLDLTLLCIYLMSLIQHSLK